MILRRSAPVAAFAVCALLALPRAGASAPSERTSLPRQTLSDLRALFSPRSALILTTGAVATGFAYAVEDPDAAEEFLGRGALDTFSDAGNVYGSTYFLGSASLGAWALGSALGEARLAGTGRDALEAIVLSQCVVVPMKAVVDRERPDGERYSFPSGHMANAASVVPILWRSHGAAAGIVASGLALCTALGRQEDRRHYLSDVVGGATIGFAIGDVIARRAEEEARAAARGAASEGSAVATADEGAADRRVTSKRAAPRLDVSPRAISLRWTW
jgi:membrane-associated phospholipid phosphatase